jgi:hypothetical protein
MTACRLCGTPIWRPESHRYGRCAECLLAPNNASPTDERHAAFLVAAINILGARIVTDERQSTAPTEQPNSESIDPMQLRIADRSPG